MDEMSLMSAPLQGAFAGLCLILLAIIVWLIRNLLSVLKENNRIIAENSAAIRLIHDTSHETKVLISDIRDDLLQRPCLMGKGKSGTHGC